MLGDCVNIDDARVFHPYISDIMEECANRQWENTTDTYCCGYCSIASHRKWPNDINPIKSFSDHWWVLIGDMANLSIRMSVYMMDSNHLLFTYWDWNNGKIMDYYVANIADPGSLEQIEKKIRHYSQIMRITVFDRISMVLGIGKYARLEKWFAKNVSTE